MVSQCLTKNQIRRKSVVLYWRFYNEVHITQVCVKNTSYIHVLTCYPGYTALLRDLASKPVEYDVMNGPYPLLFSTVPWTRLLHGNTSAPDVTETKAFLFYLTGREMLLMIN